MTTLRIEMLTVIAVLLFGAAGQSLLAQATDRFTAASRMTTARAAHAIDRQNPSTVYAGADDAVFAITFASTAQ